MRYAAAVSLLALTMQVGCLRFGYEPASRPEGPSGGTSGDSGMPQRDGSVGDAASTDGSVRPDAGMPDAADGDAGSDSGEPSTDGAVPSDGATTEPGDGGSSDGSIGATDSGSTDSGPMDSDAGEFDDPKRTAQCPDIPGAVFCDGFEATSGFSPWTYPIEKNGTVARSTTIFRRGSGSLHAHTNPSTSSSVETAARLSVKAVDHLTSGNLFARYFYLIPSSVNLNTYISSAVFSEYEPPYYGFSVVISSTQMGLASGGAPHFEDNVFPLDQWVCVEMHVAIAEHPQGTWAFFREGALIYRETNDTRPDQGLTVFEVGIHFSPNGQGAADAYVDDVVVGTERIGCSAELTSP